MDLLRFLPCYANFAVPYASQSRLYKQLNHVTLSLPEFLPGQVKKLSKLY